MSLAVMTDQSSSLETLCPRIHPPSGQDWESLRACLSGGARWEMGQDWLSEPEAGFAPAVVWTGHSGDRLHVLAELQDEEIFTSAAGKNDSLWLQGDVFEIFIGLRGHPGYIEYHIAPNGCTLQLLWPDAEALMTTPQKGLPHFFAEDSAAVLRATHSAGGWTAYAEIPASSIPGATTPLSGQVWDASFSRYDETPAARRTILSTTSPHTQAAWHRRAEWRALRMAE